MDAVPPPASFSAQIGRRWYVTLLFSDLSDATKLSTEIELEDYQEVLACLKRDGKAIVARHGGAVVGFQGDGVLAMFGFPEPSEYDGRSAAEAALELHEAMSHVRVPLSNSGLTSLSVHSGIHLGLAVLTEDVAAVGGLEVSGRAANTAARLCKKAGPNQIFVSKATLGHESHFFEVQDLGEIRLEGIGGVDAYSVVRRAPVATRYQARVRYGLTPFVGRAHELTLLKRGLQAAIGGHLQAISVAGSPGIGKTRLVEEFLETAAARGCTILKGYCADHGQTEPLQPFRQMLRGTSTASLDSSGSIRDLFLRLTVAGPLVIFIDDWHWADDASRKVLSAIRELSSASILIITTSRASEQKQLASTDADITVGPLDGTDVIRTIQILRPGADPSLIRDVQNMAGGNPLYIEELCHSSLNNAPERSLRATGDPTWLNAFIESRVAKLPPQLAEFVRAAAVVGNVIPGWILQELTGFNQEHPVVRDLAARDLLFAGDAEGTLRFKHGITRRAIYDSLGLRRRAEMHLQVAQLLEERFVPEQSDDLLEALAYHYREAACTEKAIGYGERAGDKALAAAALDRARSQYVSVLGLLPASDQNYERWVSVAQRLGLTCVFDASPAQLPLLQLAVDLAVARNDDATLARAHYWVGYVHYALGDLSVAIESCEKAEASCQRAITAARDRGDTPASTELEAHAVQILATLGQARAAACEYDGVLEQLEEAIAIKRRYRRGTRPAVGSAYTLACLGGVLADLGRFDEAHRSFAEALEAVGQGNQPVKGSILAWQGAVYTWQRRWADALAVATEAQLIGRRVESVYVVGISQALGGFAQWKLDGTREAIDTITRAVSWLDSRHKRLFISISFGWLAEALAEAGRYEEARIFVARALRRSRQRDRFGEAMAYRVMARMPSQYRRYRSATGYIQRALAASLARHSPHEEAETLCAQAELLVTTNRQSTV
jgi:class 3 adenylate cyclase/tetratricopeptide (TPR) repeat protein